MTISVPHRLAFWPCLTLLSATTFGACKGAPDAPAPEAPPGAAAPADEPSTRTVSVDESLLTTGRIALTEVTAFAHGGQLVVPGEVAPGPDGEAEIGSLVAGRVASLDAVEGAAVTKGQVLAWIDAPEVGSVRADLARASAQSVAAQQRLDRQLALQLQGATSQSAVDEARAAVLSAQADQQGARAKLGSVGVGGVGSTGRLALRSPIDGVIVERHATLGGAVAPDATLFRVIDPKKVRVRAQWSETLGPIPTPNSGVHLSSRAATSSSAAAPCEATIETHLGLIDPVTRSVTLQIQPGKGCPSFTTGAYVDVFVAPPGGSKTSVADWVQVPLEAVVDLRGMPTVFVALAEVGRFEVRTVEPRPSLGNVVPIALGLTAGEKVASKGVVLLKGEALGDILGGE